MLLPTKTLVAGFVLLSGMLLPRPGEATPVELHPAEARDVIDPAMLGEALAEEGLAKQDGRQDIQIDQLNTQMSEIKNNTNFGGNTLSALNSTVTTGLNSIGEAFSNASGIVTVIQNSGNQVLIQNDMILNLWVK